LKSGRYVFGKGPTSVGPLNLESAAL
jgi:hypothetical protein